MAAENGEMFKDARIQERITDQIHAVEFDMEDVPTTEVGSLLGAESPQRGSFQRIEDDDAPAAERPETAFVQETVAAHVDAFIDEIGEETAGAGALTFERVSDDEVGTDEAAEPKGKRASKRAATKRGAKKEAATEVAAEVEEPAAAKPKRASKAAAKKTAAKKSSKKASKRGSSRAAAAGEGGEGETDMAVLETEAERAESADVVAAEAADGEHFEAGARQRRLRRRRGRHLIRALRGRVSHAPRRATPPPPDRQVAGRRTARSAPTGRTKRRSRQRLRSRRLLLLPRRAAGLPRRRRAAIRAATAPSAARAQTGPRAKNAARVKSAASGARTARPATAAAAVPSGASAAAAADAATATSRPSRTSCARARKILVQIAKEPIAKKGARITSHIALPGRFLVYMPTVEHVGVSRKIESDTERARLRKLIQAIRAEEDVPSGGFIVRTAGVGISEEDLRDDVRYLVRTWLDIRTLGREDEGAGAGPPRPGPGPAHPARPAL